MSRSTNAMFSEMRPTIDREVYWQGKMGLLEFKMRGLQSFFDTDDDANGNWLEYVASQLGIFLRAAR